ncbi:MAG: N-methyl-L-tryptophan oxidase [Anaerolineae bacterium]
MSETADLIVLGAGAVGSAAAYHAARRNLRVILLEQYEIDHQRGSSYGASRIIRYAYDHPAYVKLARAAYPAWAELEREAGETLVYPTGGVDIGRRGEPPFEATIQTLQAEHIPFELLGPVDAQRRFPQFRLDDDMLLLYQADAAILPASRCVRAHVRLATHYGAVIHAGEPVLSADAHTHGVTVRTEKQTYSAAALVMATGAWANDLLAPLGFPLPLRPVQAQENYFAPVDPSQYEVGTMPVFIAHLPEYPFRPYGLPSMDGSGFKVALHGGPDFDPHRADRPVDDAAIASVRQFAERHLPGATGRHLSSRVCLYTMTPDEHFIVDAHPAHPNLIVSAACSGHAFKFSTLLGSILVDLATDGVTLHDLSLFRASRFAQD